MLNRVTASVIQTDTEAKEDRNADHTS
jgi:hypothetical protein